MIYPTLDDSKSLSESNSEGSKTTKIIESLSLASGENNVTEGGIEVVEVAEIDIAENLIEELGSTLATVANTSGDQAVGEEMYDIEVEMDDFFHVIHNVHDSTLQVSILFLYI